MRVLIAFDGSHGATTALDLTRVIPWPAGSVLELFRVDSSGASSLAEPAATLAREGITVEQKVERWDSPQEALVSEAARIGADLIITGSRGHGPMTTAFIGSVARGIAEHAPCPVLIARRPTFGNLLFAEDGSPSAFNARRILATWPIFSGHVLHVLSIAQVKTPVLSGVAAAVSADARRAQQDAEMEARSSYGRLAVESAEQLRIAGVAAESEVRSGDPAEEILATAERRGTDVIVLGSRGRDDLARVMLGSVAREVLLRAHCSVMVVRKS